VKILSLNNAVYVIHPDGVTWPIFSWQEPEKFIFQDLSQGDSFVDAAVYDTNIMLLTESWKVVNFAKNNFYSYRYALRSKKSDTYA